MSSLRADIPIYALGRALTCQLWINTGEVAAIHDIAKAETRRASD